MVKKIIIVGGVAGGASCAARLRRMDEHAEITIIERGPYISFANCGLPYHLSGVISSREALLVQTVQGFISRFNVNVLVNNEAINIDKIKKIVSVKNLQNNIITDFAYDYLVLSPGAEPIKPPISSINLPGVHVLRSIPDMDAIIKHIKKRNVKNAVVVGAGFIGLETAENLAHLGMNVSIIEMVEQVMPLLDVEIAAPLAQELSLHGVQVRTGTQVQSIREENTKLIVDLKSGEMIKTDLVVMSVGVRPEVKLAKNAELEIGQSGGIKVDNQMRTSDKNIFAVGDAAEITDKVTGLSSRIPLAGPANRQGRLVADIICGRDVYYKGAIGTSIVKVFNQVAASTGLSERNAKKLGINHKVVWVHGASHAGYYPGALPLTIKLIFSPTDGKILGAQAVGQDGIDKRMDVLASALSASKTVYDLEELDLSYAPPFSSAKDPVNHVGAVAANMLRGDHATIQWDEIKALDFDKDYLVDVRTNEEYLYGNIKHSVNIPLDDIRKRLLEFPKNKRIVIYCQAGLRGYLAYRILVQHGYTNVVNLLGGYKLWHTVTAPIHVAALNPDTVKSSEELHSSAVTNNQINNETLETLDACGLSCPGPILKLKEKMDTITEGTVLEVTVTDPGFVTDLPAWAFRTGHEVLSIIPEGNKTKARIRKKGYLPVSNNSAFKQFTGQTIVVFSGELDKALAAMVIATGGASIGKHVTMFFTFWGLNLLRKTNAPAVNKNMIEAMFGKMMPKGSNNAKLSKMDFWGMGRALMNNVMHKKNVPTFDEFIETAKKLNVRLVACQMSMDVMGLKREELIDGVEVGGVAAYLDAASESNINLFV